MSKATPVFEDLGFPRGEAEHLKIRSDLMIDLCKVINAKGLKQAERARLLGVTQPRFSDLFKGKIELFSIDTLIDMRSRAGCRRFRRRVLTNHMFRMDRGKQGAAGVTLIANP